MTHSWHTVLDTLSDVVDMMRHNIAELMDRGMTVDKLEERSEELAATSQLFLVRVLPWYKRMWYRVYACMCCPVHCVDRWICCRRHPWWCCRRHRTKIRTRSTIV